MNLAVAAGIVAAIGDISRVNSPQKLVSYFGLNPRVRQSGLGAAHHGRISKIGRSHARAMLVEAAWNYRSAPRRASRASVAPSSCHGTSTMAVLPRNSVERIACR